MKNCAVTGSFDPITIGHLDVIRRATKCFDKVCVLMLINPKKIYLNNHEERLRRVKEAVREFSNVDVAYYEGLTVDYINAHDISCIVRGIRNSEDYIYEQNMASENMKLGNVMTLFMLSNDEYKDISSTRAREAITQGDYSMLPSGKKELI